jgi:bifunctional DNA-binding transcriptional regulator/antitoxin component of YhaV-PrlF toxin-antitoxin module
MREITTTLKLDKQGRVLIPLHIREKLKDDLVEIVIRIPENE